MGDLFPLLVMGTDSDAVSQLPPLPTPVTALMLLTKMRFPWVHIVSENQIGRDSVNEVFY